MKRVYPTLLVAALALPAWAGSVKTPSHPAQNPTSPNTSVETVYSNQADSPPGVLTFDAHEVNRQMGAYTGSIAGIYRARLPSGGEGHLILVIVPQSSNPIGVVQPDTADFSLHKGERVIVLRSPENAWMRVLPYNGPQPSSQRK